MNVLAFDTCFTALSVAVRRDGRDFTERLPLETGHAEALMPMIARVMREAGLAFSDLDRIVVTQGPGTFTGVRTGIAAARALALATGAALIGASSLWAIAVASRSRLPHAMRSGDALLVAMDARKGQIYAQAFDIHDIALTEPLLISVAEAVALCPDRHLRVIGNATLLVVAALTDAGREHVSALDESELPGQEYAEAAALLQASSRAPCVGPLQPLYLRPPDAKPQADKSLPWVTT